jgi:hypothetical protein
MSEYDRDGGELAADLAEAMAGDAGVELDDGDDIGADIAAAVAEVGEDEPAGDSVADDIASVLEEQGNALAEGEAKAKADAAWRKELNSYLEPHRAALDGIGKGSKEAIRRLFRAEAALRADPGAAMAYLARAYTNPQDEARKASIAHSVLASLGYEAPGQLAQAERVRLQHFEAQQRHAEHQAQALATEQLQAFSAANPHFPRVRQHMAAAMIRAANEGREMSLAQAYSAACGQLGLNVTSPADLDAARRASVAKAKAASTPRSSSSRGAVADEDTGGDTSIRGILKSEFASRSAAGGRI